MSPFLLLAALLPLSMFSSLDSAYIVYDSFHRTSSDPWLREKGYSPHEGMALGLDVNLLPGLYFDNRVKAVTDTGQYRSIGWEFHIFIVPFKNFEIGYHHESRHMLDAQPASHFPTSDSLEVKWILYGNPNPRKSWF